jgi:hypothetical protein
MKSTNLPRDDKNFADNTYVNNITIKSVVYKASLNYIKQTDAKDKNDKITGYTYLDDKAKSITIANANPSYDIEMMSR